MRIDRQLSLFDADAAPLAAQSRASDAIPAYERDLDGDLWNTIAFTSGELQKLLGAELTRTMSVNHVLQQAAALICLDVLSQDISKATLRLKERLKGGGSQIVDPVTHPVAAMLALEPNDRHTWIETIGMWVYHLGLCSNSHSYIRRANDGTPLSIVPLVPGRAFDLVDTSSGQVFYDVSAQNLHEIALLGFESARVPERDVLHFRHRMLDGFWGFSTVRAGSKTLRLSRSIEEYQSKLFSENGVTPGAFVRDSSKGELTDAAFRRITGQLKKLRQQIKRGADDPILLEDGIKYDGFGMTAQEAELAESLDASIAATCRLWRIPPHKAMHLNAVKYENLGTMETVYVRDTLLPICRPIEARLSKGLLDPKERLRFFFEFDRDEMAVADEKNLTDRVVRTAERGLFTINEERVALGRNPVPWGDLRIVPVNTVLVDKDNKVVVQGAKGAQPQDPSQQDQPQEPPAKDAPALRLVS